MAARPRAEPVRKSKKPTQQKAKVSRKAEEKPKRKQRTTAEWRKIRLEYVKGKTTLKQLAEKWGLSESTIRKRASNEGWKKRKHKLDTKVEQKTLERLCDARAREFEQIAHVNDRMTEVLDNLVSFIQQQKPNKYDDLRGVESLTKAIGQVVAVKRDLYNMPTEAEKAKIESLREKAKLDRERWQDEQAEKAASKTAAESTVFRIVIEGDEDGEPLDE